MIRRLLPIESIVEAVRKHVVTAGLLAVFFLLVMVETVVAYEAGGVEYQHWFAATPE